MPSSFGDRVLLYTPGVLLAVVVGAAGRYLSEVIPYVGGVTFAILLGIVVGNLLGSGTRFEVGIKFAEKRLLELAIILLGLDLQFALLGELGWSSLLFVIVLVAATVAFGRFLGPRLGLSQTFGLLLGVGAGICGSSAIAAVAPLVDAEDEEVGLSVGAINLIGVFGIFLVPAIVVGLGMSDRGGGLLAGGSLPAVGHVVAAGFTVNEVVGKLATVVKMGRVLLLGPMVLVLAALLARSRSGAPGERKRVGIPVFILGFFVMSALVSLSLLPEPVVAPLREAGKWLLVIAMAAIGLRIQLASLLRQGPRALLVAGVLVAVQIGLLVVFLQVVS